MATNNSGFVGYKVSKKQKSSIKYDHEIYDDDLTEDALGLSCNFQDVG